jgi:predicted O-methyltransferase YrrM
MIKIFKTVLNITRFLWKNNSYEILFKKLTLRLRELGKIDSIGAYEWASEHAVPFKDLFESLDSKLYVETCAAAQRIRQESEPIIVELSKKGIHLGGGGSIELLYFLCRFIKPDFVLETGVAAGWSSYAILESLAKNQKGHLDSSDLPYFRIENPENYIGILVPERLRLVGNWNLKTLGDSKNLDSFLTAKKRYSLVHYDSDKRRDSRKLFLARVKPFLSDDAILIMDDIQDNFAFRDHVIEHKTSYRVFEYEGKFVGVTLPVSLINL